MKTTFFIVSALSVAANATKLMGKGPLVETNVYGNGENDEPLVELNIDADGEHSGPLIELNIEGSGDNSEPLVELNVYGGSDCDSCSDSESDVEYCDYINHWECGPLPSGELSSIFSFFDEDGDGEWSVCEFYKGIVCSCQNSPEDCLIPDPQDNQDEVYGLF